MWCVPCFVMATGALLLDEKRNVTYKKIFTRYIPRILTALIICVFLFRFLDCIFEHETFGAGVITDALYKLYTGSSWAHLWYLYLLIGIYLLIPVLMNAVKSCSDSEINVFMAVCILFVSIVPVINMITGVKSGFYISINSVYPVYLLAGYMIDSNGTLHPHSWTEIVIDGEVYLCDPNLTMETGHDGFMKKYGASGTWKVVQYHRMN